MDMALSDIRVLDLTHGIAGPYCTKMLADYGADVVKVERPDGGDFARRLGPFPGDSPHPEKSGLFLMLNINKRGVTLDLKTSVGKRMLTELVRQTDVLVESFSPRVMSSLGLSYESLAEANPGLVMVSISNFGQTGPYRDFKASEMVLYGMGGAMHSRGLPGREPVKYGTNVVLYQAGLIGALAAMTGLFARRRRGGDGEHVDVSIFETAAHSRDGRSPDIIAAQFINQVRPRREPGSTIASGTFPCKDGYIVLGAGGARFPQALAMLGRPELKDDPRFATREAQLRPENVVAFNEGIMLPGQCSTPCGRRGPRPRSTTSSPAPFSPLRTCWRTTTSGTGACGWRSTTRWPASSSTLDGPLSWARLPGSFEGPRRSLESTTVRCTATPWVTPRRSLRGCPDKG